MPEGGGRTSETPVQRAFAGTPVMERGTLMAHLAAIVEGSDDAIASKDLKGIIQTWNPGAQRIFGFTPEEAIGKPMTLIFPPDRLHEEAAILKRITRGQRIEHYETMRRRKDGALLNVSVTVSPIRDASGVVVGASNIARDISERIGLEARLRRANERLQRLDQERRAFLNLVSHELRTPLTPVMIQLEFLRATLTGPEAAQGLAVVERNMQRLANLVEQVLGFARLEGGPTPPQPRTFDLCQLAHESLETFKEVAVRAGVRFEVRCTAPVPVHADPDRVAQILVNLVSNAIKFTPAGGQVTMTVVARDGEGVLEVTDTGLGFVPEEGVRLFQPFVRLHDGKPGTGLGLFISRTIALQHGGELVARSAGPGRGALFRLTLPGEPRKAA